MTVPHTTAITVCRLQLQEDVNFSTHRTHTESSQGVCCCGSAAEMLHEVAVIFVFCYFSIATFVAATHTYMQMHWPYSFANLCMRVCMCVCVCLCSIHYKINMIRFCKLRFYKRIGKKRCNNSYKGNSNNNTSINGKSSK